MTNTVFAMNHNASHIEVVACLKKVNGQTTVWNILNHFNGTDKGGTITYPPWQGKINKESSLAVCIGGARMFDALDADKTIFGSQYFAVEEIWNGDPIQMFEVPCQRAGCACSHLLGEESILWVKRKVERKLMKVIDCLDNTESVLNLPEALASTVNWGNARAQQSCYTVIRHNDPILPPDLPKGVELDKAEKQKDNTDKIYQILKYTSVHFICIYVELFCRILKAVYCNVE